MKSFEEVYREIQAHLYSLEELRKNQRYRMWIFILSWILVFFIGILFFLTGKETVILIALFIIIGYGIVALIYGRKAIYKFKQTYKDIVIGPLVRAIGPGLQYQKNNYINSDRYYESRIFLQTADRYIGEDYVYGMIDKTAIEFSELHTEYRTQDEDGKTHYHTIFKGLFLVADFHKDFKSKVVVMPDYTEKVLGGVANFFQKINISRDKLVYMEDPEFEKMFKVYSNDQVEARYILSPNMLNRIVLMKKRLNKKIHLSFVNSKMFLAISMNKNLFNPKLNKSVLNPYFIQEFYQQIIECVQVVDEMNLNTRIWSKQ
ncbi:MAG TPA: DUF3137 domain-containing protein [Bacteroidales bacterium]|nr:DUF3137 domain-containing protein [Bacteroidales bacterium]